MQKTNHHRAAECNGGRIYGGESSAHPQRRKKQLQRDKSETFKAWQPSNSSNECGLRAERLISVGANRSANSDRSRQRSYKRGGSHFEATKASSKETSKSSNTAQQVISDCDRENQPPRRVDLQQQRRRGYHNRRTRRCPSGRQNADYKLAADEKFTAETTSNEPSYLASLSKLSLSPLSRLTKAANETTANYEDNERNEYEHELPSSLVLGSRKVVLDHYIKHNIEEDTARCGCHFNRLRGFERNLLSELEEFYRYFSINNRSGNVSSSSGRLTARASELSIEGGASYVNSATASAAANQATTHLEQTRNLKLDKPAGDGTSLAVKAEAEATVDYCATTAPNSNLSGSCIHGHGGLFIDESDVAATRSANSRKSVTQSAHTCSNCSSTSSGLSEQPTTGENDRQGENKNENERESTNSKRSFHCQCRLARINSPNSLAEAEARAPAVDDHEELLIAQRKPQERTTSESLLVTSSPLTVSNNEEDRQVSSLSWDKFDLFAPSQTQHINKAKTTPEQHRQQQITATKSGGCLTPTASFYKGNIGAPPVLLISSDDEQEEASFKQEELPFSFEEAESLLTDELAFSEAGNALESFAESLLEESTGSNNNNSRACECACDCCSKQRRRQRQGAKDAANLSTWSISDNLMQQLEQLAGSDNSFRRRRRQQRPNCCCQEPRSFEPSCQQQQFGNLCSLTTDSSTLSLSWPQISPPNFYDSDYNEDNDENKVEEAKAERIAIRPSATESPSEPERRNRGDLNFKLESLDDNSPTTLACSYRRPSDTLAAAASAKRARQHLRKGKSRSCFDEKFERSAFTESPERSAHETRENSVQSSAIRPETIGFRRTWRGNDNCCEKESASYKMGIDGASGFGSELTVGSSTQRQSTGPTKAAESAEVGVEEESQQQELSSKGESSSGKQTESCDSSIIVKAAGLAGSGDSNDSPSGCQNNSESQQELEDDDDASGYKSASDSMKAVKDIAKVSIPSLSALQYLPGQLDLSGRPKAAYAKQLPQQQPKSQNQQQSRQPLPTSAQQQQRQQSKQSQIARGGNTVKVITESSGEDVQHDESCLIHRLCLCNCMSRQHHAAGMPDPSSSQASKERKRRHVKRSKVRSSAANATASAGAGAAGNTSSDIDNSRGEMVEKIVQDENDEGGNEEEDDSDEELPTRSESIKRRVASSEKQSPTFLGLLKSSAAAVHLTRRQPTANLVHQQRRGADLMVATKLGSAGDLEASATGSASSSRNDSDVATTSGSLSYLRSRSTSFTTSEQRRAQSPTSNDYTSIAEDDFDDSLSSSDPLSRSQSACGSRPTASCTSKHQQDTGKGAGSRAKPAYKKLLSPSRLFSSRSPSPQPALSERIAAPTATDKSSKQQGQQCDDDDNVNDARKQSNNDRTPSFLARSLNRLSGRKSSAGQSSKRSQGSKILEAREAKSAATVGSDPNISASIRAAAVSRDALAHQSISISQSNLSSSQQEDTTSPGENNWSLNSSLADEVVLSPTEQATSTTRQALVGQQQHQIQGVNKLVARAPQARQTPQIVLSRAELIAAQGENGNKARDMARIRGYAGGQEQQQHYHYGSGVHTAYSSQRYGSEISADLSTPSGDNLSERALSLPASPRTNRRNYHQDRRQNPSPRLRESPVPFKSPPSESTKIEDGLEVCSMEHFEKHIGNIKDTQVEAQKCLFTTWINHFCPNLIQRDLVDELKDGIKLIGLIASLTKDKDMIGHYERLARDRRAYINRLVVTPSSRLRHLSNVSIAIDHLREKVGMKLINLNPMDVVSGKPNVVLGLCWNIILHFQFEQNFLKHLETCEDSKVLLMEQTLKSWVSYEEARRRLKDWLAIAEAKLCDALGPIIMMNSTEELAANQAIGISSANQPFPTFDPIMQHTDRLEDLIKYFELEEVQDPVLSASSDQLASLSRQLSTNGQQPAAASPTPLHQPLSQAQQSSLENLRLPPTTVNNNTRSSLAGDNRSISGSLLSLGSCSSRMSSLQSSKDATYRKLFDNFAAKCRLLARMLGRNQRDALLFGVKELKARLKYITEQRVPQVVNELRMSINRCEMSIKEQNKRVANLSGGDEDANDQLGSSTDPNADDSNEVTSDLEESKDDEENEDEGAKENSVDDNESEQTPTRQQPSRSTSPTISTAAKKAHKSETSAMLAASAANLTSSSELASSEARPAKVVVGEERRMREVDASEQQVAPKKDKNSSKNNNSNKNLKNKRGSSGQTAATKAGNSQPVKTHASQQHQHQQRGKQACASKQDVTAAGTWSLLNWLLSDRIDNSSKLVAKTANKKRKHMSSHKSGKSHKSRSNRDPPSKQQVSSKATKDGMRVGPDNDDSQSISYTRVVWHKILRAYRTSLSLNIVLLICLAGICIVPFIHRETCCNPTQPSQILSEEALSMNERPT